MCSRHMIHIFFYIIRRPTRSTRTDTLVPDPTCVRSCQWQCRMPAKKLTLTKTAEPASSSTTNGDAPLAGPSPRMLLSSNRYSRHVLRRIWLLFPSIRSEEHTSELQSLMRISYAVFCLKKKKQKERHRKKTDINLTKNKIKHHLQNT